MFFTCMEHFDLHIAVLNSIILLKAGKLVNCCVNQLVQLNSVNNRATEHVQVDNTSQQRTGHG